jgi:hypothetical protein
MATFSVFGCISLLQRQDLFAIRNKTVAMNAHKLVLLPKGVEEPLGGRFFRGALAQSFYVLMNRPLQFFRNCAGLSGIVAAKQSITKCSYLIFHDSPR